MRDWKTGIITLTLAALLVMGIPPFAQAHDLKPGETIVTALSCDQAGMNRFAEGISAASYTTWEQNWNAAQAAGECFMHPRSAGEVVKEVRRVMDYEGDLIQFVTILYPGMSELLYVWHVLDRPLTI